MSEITAETIKSARTRLDESQEAFAKRFRVDQSTLHRWETEGPPSRGAARLAIEHVLSNLEGAGA